MRAIVEMFLMKLVKLVDCEQKLWRVLSLVLFSGDMYPLEPISKGRIVTFLLSISLQRYEYFWL